MIKLEIPFEDETLQGLQSHITVPICAEGVTNEAFALYAWVVSQLANGRYLVSVDYDMTNPLRPSFPYLDSIGRKK